jgi:hypothetical protein
MATKSKEIKYLNRDFSQFRDNLINFAKNYFPNTYNDFNESDPGMMFIEMASYVGDVLSYYVDSQLKESLLAYAEEKPNVYAIAQSLGYKPKISVPSAAEVSIYQLLPASGSVVKKPDWNYSLTIQPGLQLKSTQNDVAFICYDYIDFSYSSSIDPTTVSIYSFNGSDPEYFLIEKKIKVISGELNTLDVSFDAPKKFNKVRIDEPNVIGIFSVSDSDGNTWTEVPYLAQETIFEKVPNTSYEDPELSEYAATVPYLLRLKKVPKRFTTRVTSDDKLELQFGAGISDNPDEIIVPNPDNVGQGIPADNRNLDLDYDPSNFMYTKTYGEVPTNTTLTIKYLTGGGIISNVPANTITGISNLVATTKNGSDEAVNTFVRSTFASTNPKPATGGRSGETVEEIRQRALATFSTQNRNVTLDDYAVRAYSMPTVLGGVSKVHIMQDDQLSLYDKRTRVSNPLGLNFYCLGYDLNKNLIALNDAAKQNLKTYLSEYKMLTDGINIKDAYIINIGVQFEVIILSNYNSNEVLLNCIQSIKNYFDIDKWQINQPIYRSEIYGELLKVPGVQYISGLRINNLFGESRGYSNNYYDLARAERKGIIYPSLDPCIFEIKYPDIDIIGRVTTT